MANAILSPDPVLSPWAGASFTLAASALRPETLRVAAAATSTLIRPNSFFITFTGAPTATGAALPTYTIDRPYNQPLPVTFETVASPTAVPTAVNYDALLSPSPTIATLKSDMLTPSTRTHVSTTITTSKSSTDSTKTSHHGNEDRLPAYQIFLIVFFGLASIPISVALFLLTRTLRRPRDLEYDEEWSSSFWKRHRPSGKTGPGATAGTGAYPVTSSSSKVTAQEDLVAYAKHRDEKAERRAFRAAKREHRRRGSRQWGQGVVSASEQPPHSPPLSPRSASAVPAPSPSASAVPTLAALRQSRPSAGSRHSVTLRTPTSPHPGTKVQLAETEVGRAWGRPRRVEDEVDRVVIVPRPSSGTGTGMGVKKLSAIKVPAPLLTRASRTSPTLVSPFQVLKEGPNGAAGDDFQATNIFSPRSARFNIDDGRFDDVGLENGAAPAPWNKRFSLNRSYTAPDTLGALPIIDTHPASNTESTSVPALRRLSTAFTSLLASTTAAANAAGLAASSAANAAAKRISGTTTTSQAITEEEDARRDSRRYSMEETLDEAFGVGKPVVVPSQQEAEEAARAVEAALAEARGAFGEDTPRDEVEEPLANGYAPLANDDVEGGSDVRDFGEEAEAEEHDAGARGPAPTRMTAPPSREEAASPASPTSPTSPRSIPHDTHNPWSDSGLASGETTASTGPTSNLAHLRRTSLASSSAASTAVLAAQASEQKLFENALLRTVRRSFDAGSPSASSSSRHASAFKAETSWFDGDDDEGSRKSSVSGLDGLPRVPLSAGLIAEGSKGWSRDRLSRSRNRRSTGAERRRSRLGGSVTSPAPVGGEEGRSDRRWTQVDVGGGLGSEEGDEKGEGEKRKSVW